MIIRDSFKTFSQGIGKVISPKKTAKTVLKKLRLITPPILGGFYEVRRPSQIPQYRFIGTARFQQIVHGKGTNGKGHFREQAQASGSVEFAERYSCFRYLRDPKSQKIMSFSELKNNAFKTDDLFADFIDPSEAAILKNKEIESAKIRFIAGYTLSGKKVFIPMNLIGYLIEGTNGMAAGNSLEEALLHAICEVMERHCLSLIDVNRLTTPLIDQSTIKFPIVKSLLKKFQRLHQPVFIKDFSLGIGLPTIGAIRMINRTSCMITAGVATSREEALIRALTENSQCEDKSNFIKIKSAKYYLANKKTVSINDISDIDNDNIKLELDKIYKTLKKNAMEVFFVDSTDKVLKIPSVIVYISGAKYFVKTIAFRNIITGLIEESLATENYRDARKHLRKATESDKKNQLVYLYYQGVINKRFSRYELAKKYFSKSKSTTIRELRRSSLINLGHCYQATNNIDQAIYYCLKVIDRFPEFSIEYLQSNYDQISLLAKDKAHFSIFKKLYYEVKFVRKYYPQNDVFQFKPKFFEYMKNEKATLLLLNEAKDSYAGQNYRESIERLKKILNLSRVASRIHNVYLLIGFCLEKTGQYRRAIFYFKKALTIDPGRLQILFSLSQCYRKIGDDKLANETMDRGIKSSG